MPILALKYPSIWTVVGSTQEKHVHKGELWEGGSHGKQNLLGFVMFSLFVFTKYIPLSPFLRLGVCQGLKSNWCMMKTDLLWWLPWELHRNLPSLMLTNKREGWEQEHLIKLWNNNSQASFKSFGGCIPFLCYCCIDQNASPTDGSKPIGLEKLELPFSRAILWQMETLVVIPSPLCSFLEPFNNSVNRRLH